MKTNFLAWTMEGCSEPFPPFKTSCEWTIVMKKCLQEVIFKKSLISSFFTSAWFGMLPAGKSNLVISNWTKLFLQKFIKRVKLSLVIKYKNLLNKLYWAPTSNKNYKIDKISKLEKYRKNVITCYNHHHNNCVLLRLIKCLRLKVVLIVIFESDFDFECKVPDLLVSYQ